MNSSKDNTIYLRHIVDSCNQIAEYIEGFDKETFLKDAKTQDAVMRQIEIIGEAIRNMEESFKAKHAEVDWINIAGMRNRLIHEYFQVNLNAVWSAAVDEVPSLKKQINSILSALS